MTHRAGCHATRVLEKARRTDVVVYAVEIRDPYTSTDATRCTIDAGTESFETRLLTMTPPFLDELARFD